MKWKISWLRHQPRYHSLEWCTLTHPTLAVYHSCFVHCCMCVVYYHSKNHGFYISVVHSKKKNVSHHVDNTREPTIKFCFSSVCVSSNFSFPSKQTALVTHTGTNIYLCTSPRYCPYDLYLSHTFCSRVVQSTHVSFQLKFVCFIDTQKSIWSNGILKNFFLTLAADVVCVSG